MAVKTGNTHFFLKPAAASKSRFPVYLVGALDDMDDSPSLTIHGMGMGGRERERQRKEKTHLWFCVESHKPQAAVKKLHKRADDQGSLK